MLGGFFFNWVLLLLKLQDLLWFKFCLPLKGFLWIPLLLCITLPPVVLFSFWCRGCSWNTQFWRRLLVFDLIFWFLGLIRSALLRWIWLCFCLSGRLRRWRWMSPELLKIGCWLLFRGRWLRIRWLRSICLDMDLRFWELRIIITRNYRRWRPRKHRRNRRRPMRRPEDCWKRKTPAMVRGSEVNHIINWKGKRKS